MTLLETQQVAIDELAKKMNATCNGHTNAKQLTAAIENMFKQRGWNFSGYCTWANENYLTRQSARNSGNRVVLNDTQVPT